LIVVAHASSPRFAADLANEFGRQFARQQKRSQSRRLSSAVRILERRRNSLGKNSPDVFAREETNSRIAKLQSLRDFSQPVQMARSAVPPGAPSSPQPVRNGLLGLLVGLTVGLIAAFGRDALDGRVRGTREAQLQTKLPLLTQITDDALGKTLTRKRRHRIPAHDFEAFRILRSNLKHLSPEGPVRTVAVTSALPEEGKTTVAAALASVSAAAGRRTLLIECDIRRPAIAQRIGIRRSPGLVDLLSEKAGSNEVLQRVKLGSGSDKGSNGSGPTEAGSFDCITAGSVGPTAVEVLESSRFHDFLAVVSRSYDITILDTSPLLPVGDTLDVIPMVEAVVLCVRAHQTTRDQAGAAMAALETFPERPTGLVVTGVRPGELSARPGYAYEYETAVETPA
jgi:capsular exopolysaccharide synthesis family protein